MAKKNWAQNLKEKAQMVIHGKNYATVKAGRAAMAKHKAEAAKKVTLTKNSPKKAIKTAKPKKLESAESMVERAKKLEKDRNLKKRAGYYQ